ncbi:MAG: phosphatidate cytidylyltransferase [Candidatus Edwardsbacteria bacterium]
MSNYALPQRILVALVFIPIFLLLMWKGGWVFACLLIVIVATGVWEFYHLLEQKGIRTHRFLGIVIAAILSFSFLKRQGVLNPEIVLTVGLLTILMLDLTPSLSASESHRFQRGPAKGGEEKGRGQREGALLRLSGSIAGIIYVSWLFSHVILLRELPGVLEQDYKLGFSYAFMPFAITWVSDTVAFFVGITLGRHKLAPSLSPQKSWEGTLAGILSATGTGVLYKVLLASYLTGLHSLILGMLVGIFALIGDLVESNFKRDAKVKDSSKLIPGHGGVLDRFDSIFFTAPVVYYYLRLFIFCR